MAGKIKVRELRRSEVREASRLLTEVIEESSKHYTKGEIRKQMKDCSEESIRHMLSRGGVIFRVAEANGKIVGVAIASLYPFMMDICWITWVAVRKGFRNRGVGSMLMRSFEKEPRKRWSAIRCHVRIGNSASNGMFRKLGYVRLKTLRRSVKKKNAYRWEKRLGG